MHRLRNWSLALAVLTVWTVPARPDDSDERIVPEEGAVHVMLLRQKSVRDALKLTADESRAIHDHNARQWKKAQEIQKLPREERHAKYQTLSRENEAFIEKVLEPSERQRLDEISLQVVGLLLVTEPRFAAKLGLTEEQKSQLKQHREEARKEMADALHSSTKESREEKIAKLRKTSRKRLMDILTDAQEATWKTMLGAPFEGKFMYNPDEEK